MTSRTMNWASAGILVLVSLVLVYAAVLRFLPVQVVTTKQPYMVLNSLLEQGDLLQYEVDYCKYLDIEPHMVHQIHGTASVRLQNRDVQVDLLDVGLLIDEGCGVIIKGVPLPKKLPPGEYYLAEQIRYPVNPLRSEHYTFRTEEFTVLKND